VGGRPGRRLFSRHPRPTYRVLDGVRAVATLGRDRAGVRMTRAQSVRTYRLRQRFDLPAGMRLTARDRAFFADLAKVGVIDTANASTYHYAENAGGAGRRLDKLVSAGLLARADIIDPSVGRIAVYAFSSDRIARAFGGRAVHTGPNRTTYHELLVSRSYFDAGCPADFRTAIQFDAQDLAHFGARQPAPPHVRTTLHGIAGEAAIPDALFTNADGELVVVEADAGHYTTRQIHHKQVRWARYKQLWVQPARARARIVPTDDVDVFTY
jgi:hypothetical protein